MVSNLEGLGKLPFLEGFDEGSLQLLALTMLSIVGKASKDAFYVQEGTARLGSLVVESGDWANITALVNLPIYLILW
jgi:hypothetical protein